MTDQFDNPETALSSAKTLMDNFPKKKLVEYLGEWNQLLVYLERQVAKQK